ncbi:MAG TPA: undecaprenyl-diphosphatase [Gammaproteobacteria bacterium]|nr:undecaprenyl-diphosphatase [Gammaproteobacteria bacterium]
MALHHIIFLALLQGLTEFLPISSSAHLILLPIMAGWQDQGLAFDIAVHVGTLIAVILYFRHTLTTISYDWFASVRQKKQVGESRLAWAILLGTIPVGIAGLTLATVVELYFRHPIVIAITTIGFGLLLAWAVWYGKQHRQEEQLTWREVLFIGVAQAIALIPGTSRSGITMTAGLLLGLTKQAAARFSFLLSIPVIVLAGGHKLITLFQENSDIDWQALGLGTAIAAVSAYLCIHYFLLLIEKIGLWPFVVYRLLLGLILILYFY